MAFHMKGTTVTTDKSFEEEVYHLCEEYSDLRVFVAHNERAGSAALLYYTNLPLEMRRHVQIGPNRWEILFPNGSLIRFLTFNEGTMSAYPDPPVHIFIAYNIPNLTIMRNMCESMRPYGGDLKKAHEGLVPLLKDGNYIFSGDDFWDELERLRTKAVAASPTGVTFGRGHTVDVSKYPKAKAVLDEEEKVMKVYEDDLSRQRQERKDVQVKITRQKKKKQNK